AEHQNAVKRVFDLANTLILSSNQLHLEIDGLFRPTQFFRQPKMLFPALVADTPASASQIEVHFGVIRPVSDAFFKRPLGLEHVILLEVGQRIAPGDLRANERVSPEPSEGGDQHHSGDIRGNGDWRLAPTQLRFGFCHGSRALTKSPVKVWTSPAP